MWVYVSGPTTLKSEDSTNWELLKKIWREYLHRVTSMFAIFHCNVSQTVEVVRSIFFSQTNQSFTQPTGETHVSSSNYIKWQNYKRYYDVKVWHLFETRNFHSFSFFLLQSISIIYLKKKENCNSYQIVTFQSLFVISFLSVDVPFFLVHGMHVFNSVLFWFRLLQQFR